MSATILRGLPAAEYHARSEYSASLLRAGQRSMLALQHARQRQGEPSDAMVLGTLCHLRVLEPHRWADEVVVRPAGLNGRTKEGKAWLSAVAATERTVITQSMADTVERVTAAVGAHGEASRLLGEATDREVTVIWEAAGIPMRSRLDLARLGNVSVQDQWVADLKTTRDASPAAFRRSCESLGYYAQAAVYLDAASAAGCWPEAYYVIAVEPVAPHDCVVYRLSDAAISLGRAQYRAVLERVAEAEAVGRWPGVSDAVVELEPSPWFSAAAGPELDWEGVE